MNTANSAISNTQKSLNSDSSIQTISEFDSRKQKFFQVILIILCLINSVIGFFLDTKIIFNEKNKITKLLFLKLFYYGYIYIFLTAIGISMLVGGIFLLIFKFNTTCSGKRKNSRLSNSFTLDLSFENYSSEGEYNFINISVVVFILSLIILYIFGVPGGIYLIYHLQKNQVLKDISRFYSLYLFIGNNILLGLILLVLFIYILFFIHIKISNKQRVRLDEELMANVEKEIEQSTKVSGKIAANPNLIKNNKLFNKQDTPKSVTNNSSTAHLSNNNSNNHNSFNI